MRPPERMARIEALIETLETTADPAARRAARELVALLLEQHEEALRALIQRTGSPAELVEACDADPALSSVLLLHGLHPRSPESRARRAVESVRERLAATGWDAELVTLEGGHASARVFLTKGPQMQGRGEGAARLVEEAIADAVPEATSITVEGAATAGLVTIRVPPRVDT